MKRFLLLLFLGCLFAVSASASIPAAAVWEVRCTNNATYCNGTDAGPSDTNGGGFVAGLGGVDMSLFRWKNATSGCTTAGVDCYSKTVDLSVADAASASGSNTHITSATANFDLLCTGNTTSCLLGNMVWLTGTGVTAGSYEVIARTSATDITLDRSAGCATTCSSLTLNIGGALMSPAIATANAVAGNVVYIQNVGADGASVYEVSVATVNVAGGQLGGLAGTFIQGYTTTRSLGNTDARPTIQLNVTTATAVSSGAATYQHLIFDGNSQTASKLVSASTFFSGILIKNFNTASSSSPFFYNSVATSNSAAVFEGGCIACEAYSNTATPFVISYCVDCISSGNTNGTTQGFIIGTVCYHCTGVSNGQDGLQFLTNTASNFVIDSYMGSNARYGFYDAGNGKAFINDSHYNNGTAGLYTTGFTTSNVGAIPITDGEPLTLVGSYNFMPNSTINRGALMLNTSDPATFPRGTTANYRDIGAAQQQATTSGQAGFVY